MAASCAQVCTFYGLPMPFCVFGGHVGDGEGTERMFDEVNARLDRYDPDVVTLHYLFPKLALGKPFAAAVQSLPVRPQLIADAGGMYLMKAVKQAALFDVFTPDLGELLFLADELAPHPLYVTAETLERARDVDGLVRDARRHRNAAGTLVVKGAVDRVYADGVLAGEVREPDVPAMEAIGGTGDTITGMLTAFRSRGDAGADSKALVVNRLIGARIGCTPATQIGEFIKAIPAGLDDYEATH
jgi:NAD(P)H-hydrate repair Nnr-like enzyme with NAD(P)H-hydrate dehydratase domain